MRRVVISVFGLVLAAHGMTVFAGSLGKYSDSQPQLQQQFVQPAPAPLPRIQLDSVDLRVLDAVNVLESLPADTRKIFLDTYEQRRAEATRLGRVKEADYYQNILSLWSRRHGQ